METCSKKRRTDGKEGVYQSQRRLGWLFSILITLLVLVAIFVVWLYPTKIDGDSMAPVLEEGELVLVDRLAKYWKVPTRGDMILFETKDGNFVKRIVGLPGETVDIVDGHVFINSCPLEESAYATNFMGGMEPITVPEGAVFLLGDNRQKIYDSRLASVGCISYEGIFGVLRVRVSPLSKVTIFF
ncbi:MAG: signal peptidase I [Clostridia bacterium]